MSDLVISKLIGDLELKAFNQAIMNTLTRTYKPYGILHTERSIEFAVDYRHFAHDARKDDQFLGQEEEPLPVIELESKRMDYRLVDLGSEGAQYGITLEF